MWNNKQGFAFLLVLFAVVVAIAATVGGALYFRGYPGNNGRQVACTMEAKLCPDGSAVGRTGSNCEFAECPNTTSTPIGKFCGGIAPGAFPCPDGYICKLDGAYPDAGGHCVLPDGTGNLRGQVIIGPNCPVERIDNPCITPPEAYASREFWVTQNGKTIATFHADMTGNYIVSLAPGTYVITSAKTGIGYMSKDLPATVIIKSGETTTKNIDVDTGIR
jgi:hypothetical protein